MAKTLMIRNQGIAGPDFSMLRVQSMLRAPDPSSFPTPVLTVDVVSYDGALTRSVVLLADGVRALRDQLDAWLEQNVSSASDSVVSGSLV